ncbi:MAG: endolytic transglycosylase MltG [Candidatus Dadabacteria bacterium]|nr:MAG: endolytic transglycosylase MltG [Candidatus Dadabacteria bacterium]
MRQWLPAILAPAIAAIAAMLTAPLYPHDIAPPSLTVDQGATLRQVLREGAKAGVFRTPRFTEWLARLTGNDIPRAGTYRLPDNGSDFDVVRLLHRGAIETTTVTLLEGWTALEYANALSRAGIVSRDAFIDATRNPDLLQRYGIKATEAEGYLFPETYRFAPRLDADTVADVLVRTFFSRLPATYATMAERVGLSLHDAVILASIIQKETYIPEEMPKVSAVFHNRLRRSMRLQADPTAIYRMPGYNGNLTRKHLRTPTPYNTYVIRGLPAGPICNPGLDALLAAVRPANSDALYFVATQDGKHVFSRTLREHNRAVRKHQLGR